MTGTIVKGIGGFYYVKTEAGVMECRARGVFRKEGIRPLCGDLCVVDPEKDDMSRGWIREILPRKNELIRPAAVSVDQAVLIFAITYPDADTGVMDRLLLNMEAQGVPVLFVLTKQDLDREDRGRRLMEIYTGAGYEVLSVSAREGWGMEKLPEKLRGKRSVLCGPSGAGKSTLIRTLFPHIPAEAGELSERIGRGKNTTRAAELYFAEKDTEIMDTPGFTSVLLITEREEDLAELFPEFRPYVGQCRFRGCRHMKEPDCRVRQALEEGDISRERYESYQSIYRLLQDRRKYS